MEHELELIIARLEILEIGVCNIIHNPGNIGNRSFLYFGRLEILEIYVFSIFRISWKIGNMIFVDFWDFDKKDARRNFTQNGPIFIVRSLI